MPKSELKPCPFCGSSNLRVTTAMGEWWVSCVECEGLKATREEAIKVWNKRSPEPVIQFDCKHLHEMFQDKDDLCPYCSQPWNENF